MNLKSSLQLIDINRIMLHEPYEPARLSKIKNAIKLDGVIRNPIIALHLENEKYLVLDGAHRLNALKEMGCLRVPIQIVDPNHVRINAWHHIVPAGKWFEELTKHPSIEVTKKVRADEIPLATLSFHDHSELYIYAKYSTKELSKKLDVWHAIVNAYSEYQEVRRIPAHSKESPNLGFIRFNYPATCLDTIKKVVKLGKLYPAGVTRIQVNGRLLNLRIPFEFLTSKSFDEFEWESLCKHREDNLRLYSENVYLYEA
ncbi:MAG: ParB N-terminal domain-containing protein [Bacillota bacterium]|uniref:ParB N-terminal domain-containing protein n=1 Tax=Fictibacillus TaxID=1329200 RepID=UPI0018CD412D|nr:MULTISPECIES: ParB N-terminal domain-containing protein [unclassified Fictibacillus]MBH0157219.1 ParB N-terminal domain-containing protein [Fictibacillus sp. 5RED26]MBH0159540.1 ParB N-terminal domain-containing protein [Fictibacillus sp. 26RED30]MBH0163661.1 ParB N-terminal domain-containing protein [Fictibacillus sp. 7GRE50]MBH0169713.1 ParB N-terminal domain-containing protein [Fictibacillus sp. 18YEL24]MBH0174213.1 ParB N-terminal domain-containing protein [Fictibacillus sp. 23RED33]